MKTKTFFDFILWFSTTPFFCSIFIIIDNSLLRRLFPQLSKIYSWYSHCLLRKRKSAWGWQICCAEIPRDPWLFSSFIYLPRSKGPLYCQQWSNLFYWGWAGQDWSICSNSWESWYLHKPTITFTIIYKNTGVSFIHVFFDNWVIFLLTRSINDLNPVFFPLVGDCGREQVRIGCALSQCKNTLICSWKLSWRYLLTIEDFPTYWLPKITTLILATCLRLCPGLELFIRWNINKS